MGAPKKKMRQRHVDISMSFFLGGGPKNGGENPQQPGKKILLKTVSTFRVEIGETHHFRKHPPLPYQTFLLRAENGKLFPWWNRKQKTAKPQSILPQPKDLQNEGPPKEPAKIQAKHQQHLAGGMKFRDESFRNICMTAGCCICKIHLCMYVCIDTCHVPWSCGFSISYSIYN